MKKKFKDYILVTGGAGYIGSNVVNLLIKKKFNVIIVDNLSSGHAKLINKKSIFLNINITNYKKLIKKLNKYQISTILHFAASIKVDESQKNPKKYYLNNVVGTENILKLALNKKINHFIFSSTCAVYGEPSKESVSEKDNTIPRNNYGLTKLFAETLVRQYSEKGKFKYAILRYFNVIGADPKLQFGQITSNSLFKKLSLNVVKKKFQIKIFGKNYNTRDGTCLRDYIDVNDLGQIHLLCTDYLKNNKSIIINCGYNESYSVLEIVKNFEKLTRKKFKISFVKKRPSDIQGIYSNSKLLYKIFPKWKRTISLNSSIKNSINWEFKLQNTKF
jgi:UDP-glucose 4-epimerase